MNKYVCIHCHFYQPPRENPWLEEVELQDSAYPYHDWNERITAECYAPNTASRILDGASRIIDIVNNYSKISFNFGPTLLSWMERHEPETYEAILEADRLSVDRFGGHGSAIAQVYNHMIVPLANDRDKYTQIFWGIRDFEKRFRRKPEGMWLPETAVDIKTLEILAACGIRFTILSPMQAKRVRDVGSERWHNVAGGAIDTRVPYVLILPSGGAINIFFYDGGISHEVAFGGLLKNGEEFARRLLAAFAPERGIAVLSHVAKDGETYGHHHPLGDMALAYCLYYIESSGAARLTNYGEFLERHPPTQEVEIFEGSSWSCAHGINRWREDCGCASGLHPSWHQTWRRPLREAMDWLRDEITSIYETEAPLYFKDPWRARDYYIDVVFDRTRGNIEGFLKEHGSRELLSNEKRIAIKLLEMQRHAMLMYTSCGWFFDEISGIETTQVLQYAARAAQLADEISGRSIEPYFVKALAEAPSNIKEFGDGARVYEMLVKPASVDIVRVGVHFAISSLFESYPQEANIYCYLVNSEVYEKVEAGKIKMAFGKARISSQITMDEAVVTFAVLKLGDHDLLCGARCFISEEAFRDMVGEMNRAFEGGDITDVIRLMDRHFGSHDYSLRDLFKDEQRKIIGQAITAKMEEIESFYCRVFDNNCQLGTFLRDVKHGVPIPKPLLMAIEFIINSKIRRVLEDEEPDLAELESLTNAVKHLSLELDKKTLEYVASSRITALMEKLYSRPGDIGLLEKIDRLLALTKSLSLDILNLWKAQNKYFYIGKRDQYREMKEREQKEETAKRWIELFLKLSDYLYVKVC